MIIDLQGDALAWYIAIVLTFIAAMLFFILMALRFVASNLLPLIPKINKTLNKFGGGEKGEGGGTGNPIMDMAGPLLGNLFGGGK